MLWVFEMKWEITIRKAQLAFQNKVYSSAIALNKEALAMACDTYEENLKGNTHKAIASVMVSHFSLADAYIATQSYDQAYLLYQKALYFIQMTHKNTLHQSVDFKASVYHAISKLKYEWCTFNKLHNMKLVEQHFISPNEFHNNLNQILKHNQTIH
jgi:tetratricopeptide (TPR) repeat protein